MGEPGERAGWVRAMVERKRKGRMMLWWNVKGRVFGGGVGGEEEVEELRGAGERKSPQRYLISGRSSGWIFWWAAMARARVTRRK